MLVHTKIKTSKTAPLRSVSRSRMSFERDRSNELLPLMFEMGRILKREITSEGGDVCTFLHIETLRFIESHTAPSMSDIADYLKIAPPSATALITTFVKDGFLERVADETDRRVIRLRLSKKGKVMLQEAMRVRAKAFSRVIAHLSRKDTRELARILSVITHSTI